jgi:uncharacterized protein YegL
MGWESFHSIWDDPVDPPSGEPVKPKRAAKKTKATNWWNEFHDDGVIDDYYGDVDKYSYGSAFDDSSKSWYQQSNFKYKRYADYSPSQLFRSAIGFRSYSGENDAKNKAIRALRTLTRNANTIVDAAKKINYTVQFSRGVDSNSGDIDLAGGKSQTVYVSADELIQTKTTEEEDAVIDALTGFTLLRVQLSQSVAADVIDEINKVSARGLARKAGTKIYETARTAEDPANIARQLAAEFVDDYMAGVISKSLLTRLARRAVVTDWGGFAPYFARHAKKFSQLAEKLTTAELSIENVAAKIAYNMAAAEDEIVLDADIAAIVDKHLGNKLQQEEILSACVALMADLRQHLITTLPQPAGELENKLGADLQPIIEKQQNMSQGLAEKEKAVGERMKEIAELSDKIGQVGDSADGMFDGAATDCYNAKDELSQLKYAEKCLEAIENIAKEYKQAADAGLTETGYIYGRHKANLSHFYREIDYLLARGLSSAYLDETQYAYKLPAENTNARAENLKALVHQGREILNERTKELKTELNEKLKKSLAQLDAWENTIKELMASVAAAASNCDAANKDVDDMLSAPASALMHAKNYLEKKINEIAEIKKLHESLRRGRATSSVVRVASQIERRVGSNALTETSIVHDVMRSNAPGTAARQFFQAAINGYYEYTSTNESGGDLPLDHWHEHAISNFVARKQLTENTFKAIAARAANSDILDLLEEQFNQKELSMPRSLNDLDNLGADIKQQFDGIAKSLGLSLDELIKIIKAAHDAEESAKYDTKNARDLGDVMRETLLQEFGELSAVDEQLFGQAVQAQLKVLDLTAISQVNDEASNAAEEDYVAYISGDAHNAKPKVRVVPATPNAYTRSLTRKIINDNKTAIDRIKNALCFQGTKRTGEVHGMLSGDLDEGSLHKLRYDCEHIWSQKNIARLPDVAVGILVDQSGSMSGEKIRQAREMCILLAEAVKKIEGMHLHIYGHSANMQGSDLTLFEHYSSYGSASHADLSGLGAIDAFSNNYDGYAIKEAAKMLSKDPAKRKYLFVLSDGLPHGRGYCGDEARKHVTSVCSFVRNRLKIPTYAFAVGVSKSEYAEFEEQYDKNKVIFLSTVQKCLPQIVRFLHSTIQKEKNLVATDVD